MRRSSHNFTSGDSLHRNHHNADLIFWDLVTLGRNITVTEISSFFVNAPVCYLCIDDQFSSQLSLSWARCIRMKGTPSCSWPHFHPKASIFQERHIPLTRQFFPQSTNHVAFVKHQRYVGTGSQMSFGALVSYMHFSAHMEIIPYCKLGDDTIFPCGRGVIVRFISLLCMIQQIYLANVSMIVRGGSSSIKYPCRTRWERR